MRKLLNSLTNIRSITIILFSGMVSLSALNAHAAHESDVFFKNLWLNSKQVKSTDGKLCFEAQTSSQYSKERPWELFCDEISGFEYEPGFIYKVRVQVTSSVQSDGRTQSIYAIDKVFFKIKDIPAPTVSEEIFWTNLALKAFSKDGEAEVECREIQLGSTLNADPKSWTGLLCQPISGFQFDSGFYYRLKVKKSVLLEKTSYALLEILEIIDASEVRIKEIFTWWIDSKSATERGVHGTEIKCINYQETAAFDKLKPWKSECEHIQGFESEDGFMYRILVEKTHNVFYENIMDAPSYSLRLVEILEIVYENVDLATDDQLLWINSSSFMHSEKNGNRILCLQSQNSPQYDKLAAWDLISEPIEGFYFEEGFVYQLKVEKKAGAASNEYKLLSIEQKIKDVAYHLNEESVFWIDSKKGKTDGNRGQQLNCYFTQNRVRYDSQSEWTPMCEAIIGLNYKPGYIYQVRVAKVPILDSHKPKEPIGYELKLIEVIQKIKAD